MDIFKIKVPHKSERLVSIDVPIQYHADTGKFTGYERFVLDLIESVSCLLAEEIKIGIDSFMIDRITGSLARYCPHNMNVPLSKVPRDKLLIRLNFKKEEKIDIYINIPEEYQGFVIDGVKYCCYPYNADTIKFISDLLDSLLIKHYPLTSYGNGPLPAIESLRIIE